MKTSTLFTFVAIGLLLLSVGACTPKKKITPKKPLAEKIVGKTEAETTLAKNLLRKMLTDKSMSIEQIKTELSRLKAQGFKSPEVLALIKQAEELLSKKQAEKVAKTKVLSFASTDKAVVSSFGAIASAANFDDANTVIDKMINEFESPDTPVLIIVAEENGVKDYDKPSTIGKYLEYVKMQKRFEGKVEEIKRNAAGKITRLILRK